MGLRKIVIARKSIRVDDNQSFQVRGLSLTDIMAAMADYGPQMTLAFAKIMGGNEAKGPITQNAIRDQIKGLAGEFPDLLAALIALAADDYDPGMVEQAKALPMLAQMDAIEAVFQLTFQSEGDVGKLMEALTRGLVKATGALSQVGEISLDGIGAYAVS